MVLKRKRSDSEISSTSSLLSSPLSASLGALDTFQSQYQIQTPSLFSSRTRKRHRDNRPSESEVHQHTLSMLFSAQSNPQPQAPPPSQYTQEAPVASLPANSQSSGHQSNLHSFFTTPSARQSSPASIFSNYSNSTANTPTYAPAMPSLFSAHNCEDCNVSLGQAGGDGMDVDMMDIDVANGGNYACEQCGKMVCHGCAVSNLGEQRRCLNCAGRAQKKWVGGLGWV